MKNCRILLIEDDLVDIMTVKRALIELKLSNPLDIKENGEEALTFLNDKQAQKPCIILLDLNMPRMNGIEFLEIIKRDDRFKSIPVVVITTSKAESDCIKSYNLGVAGYMLKPVDYTQFVEIMRTINQYWSISELPN